MNSNIGKFIVVLVAIFLAVSLLILSNYHPVGVLPPQQQAAATGSFDYIVVILMEGQPGVTGGPYMIHLGNQYSSVTHYSGVSHPSLPNYLALLGGSTFGCDGYDGLPNSNACTALAWNSQNLVDRIEAAGLRWKAYMESMPSNCYGNSTGRGGYYARHDPFVYFSDIVTNPARCARVVPVSLGASLLISDLGSASTASNFMWLTPNGCDDMHDCPLSTGDNYLSQLVPKILNSTIFKTQKAALFITCDNGNGQYPTDYVYASWSGPVVKTNYKSSTSYSHYSLAKTLETAWGLSSLTSNDSGASAMTEFFTTSTTQGLTTDVILALEAFVPIYSPRNLWTIKFGA